MVLTRENPRGVAGGQPALLGVVVWNGVGADVDAVEVERWALATSTDCVHLEAVSGHNARRRLSVIGQSVDRELPTRAVFDTDDARLMVLL